MSRGYRHIQQYESELLKLKEEGLSIRAIGERFGFSYEQTHDFFKRYNRKQRKISAKCAGPLRYREVVIMTISKEWIYRHGICLLLRRSESVRSIATALMVIVEFIYG